VTPFSAIPNHIGGKPTSPRSGATLDNVCPATGEVIATIPRSGREDVQDAVDAAHRAMNGDWGQSTPEVRADYLDAIAAGLELRREELAETESRDQGKPVSLATAIDIPRAIANFRFFAGQLRHFSDPAHPMPGALNYTHRRPIGVVGLITPWNLPLYLLSWKTAPALAMGNAIVAKPSEMTPMTASILAEVIADAGLPDGVFNLVHGLGPEVGQAIVEHPQVKAISFTGGTSTGRRVAATAAPMFKKISLELGGKNPTIVFGDADFDAALDGAVRAGFANQGEICLCGSRLLVEESIFEEFVSAYANKVSMLVVGDPSHSDTDVGALISRAHRDKVASYISLAREEGGRVLCGGDSPVLAPPFEHGFFLNPTVIDGLPIDCRTATEEIFGPVVTVHPFRDEQHALEMANGVQYGLAASVWTNDLKRAHRLSQALETGMVWVNTWLQRDLRVPFGGVKESGVGREGGRWSFDFFSEARNICIRYT